MQKEDMKWTDVIKGNLVVSFENIVKSLEVYKMHITKASVLILYPLLT